MKNIAIIPARSGSKGLVNKNIKLLDHKPLLAYSIEAAQASGIYDVVYVSTDSEQYAEIAKQYGAEVPFLRSAETATDTASSWDVVKEASYRYEQLGKVFDMVTLLQPTTPLRTAVDILSSYQTYSVEKANCVVSVCEVDHSPLWCNTLPNNHSMSEFIRPEINNQPRQKLDTFYRINGAIYMVNTEYLMSCKSIYDEKCIAHIMEKEHSVDIDDALDFTVAEAIMKANHLEAENRKVIQLESDNMKQYKVIDNLINNTESLFESSEDYLKMTSGKARFVFDIDGVVAKIEENNNYGVALPNEPMIQVINKLYQMGNYIVLLTARGYVTGINWSEKTKMQLKEWGVSYHELYFGKPNADYYIDDKMLSMQRLVEMFYNK